MHSYLLVQKMDSLPLYDERFVGYGWNKVQWIEHLRYIGYRFYVFNNGFIIHCPHPECDFCHLLTHRSESLRLFAARMKQIRKVWKTFLRDLHRQHPEKGTPLC